VNNNFSDRESPEGEKILEDGLGDDNRQDSGDSLLEFNVFKPGSIHDPKFLEFWEKELEAPAWILDVLRDGYRIPFKEAPGPYFERNNKVSLYDLNFC
jgi:hypothetical protein